MASSSGIPWRGEMIAIGPGDDADLVAKFKAGDQPVFDEIVRQHQVSVTRLARRLLGWPGDEVEDVVQEVFLAALANLKRFRGDSSLATWLTTVTVNECRTYQRKLRLQRRLWDLLGRQPRSGPGAGSEARGPEDDEKLCRVRQAVHALPPRYREVVVLRYRGQLLTFDRLRRYSPSVRAQLDFCRFSRLAKGDQTVSRKSDSCRF